MNDERAGLLEALLAGERVLPPAIPTGIAALDEFLGGGLRRGTLSVIAGEPGVGTSMFTLGLAYSAARRGGLSTLVMAPDESSTEVWLRIAAAETKAPISHLRADRATDDDRSKLRNRLAELLALPITVSAGWLRGSNQPLSENLEDYAATMPLALVIADHTPDSPDEIRRLKVMAQTHDLAVVVTATTAATGGLPTMTDPRFAMGLAEWADLIIGLHRPDMHVPISTRAGEADLRLLKHRHGPTRDLVLFFQGHYARFVEMAPRSAQ
jgi:replicative DNA helicase